MNPSPSEPGTDPALVGPRLVRVDDGSATVWPIAPGVNSVGRSSRNAICLKERSVSRFHCTLVREGGAVRIVDGEARNRTRVGGEVLPAAEPGGDPRASGRLLRDGDTLQIGRWTLRFSDPESRALAAPPAPVASSPGAASDRRVVAGRPRERRPWRARRESSRGVLAAAILIALGTLAGWWISAGIVERANAPRSSVAVDPPAPLPPGAAAGSVAPATAAGLRDDGGRAGAGPTAVVAGLAASASADEPESTRERAEHLGAEVARLEAERKRLAEALRKALEEPGAPRPDDRPRQDGELGAGADDPEAPWQRVVTGGAAEKPQVEVKPSERRALSSKELQQLLATLKEVLARFAEIDIGPESLQPELGTLCHGIGEKPVETIFRLHEYAEDLLADLDRNLAFLRKRNEEFLRRARELAGRGASEGGSVSAGGYKKSADLETAQRQLELSEKKIKIQEAQRQRLSEMHRALLGSLSEFRDPGAIHALVARFALREHTLERVAIARAFEAAGAREAIPYLIPKLDHAESSLRGAAHRALVALAGKDLGEERKAWDAWWEENKGLNGGKP